MRCEKRCEGVPIDIQSQVFVVDLFVHDLKGADIVLGVQWLAELGDIVTNHKDLTMSFQVGDKTVKLRGDSLLKSEPINAKGIKQMVEERTLACLYSLQMVPEVADKGHNSIHESVQLVVEQFSEVTGIGAVLSQQGHPVAYFSKKLNKKLSKASAYVRELYAITQAVMKWRHYLLGRRFTIKTDHKSLKELMHQNLMHKPRWSIAALVQKENKENEELQTLPWAELWYNSTFHSALGMTPYQALYGKNPSPLAAYTGKSCSVQTIDEWLQLREALQATFKSNLQRALDKMKRLADLKRKEKSFEVGQWVWVKFHPYRQTSVAKRLHFKLARRFYGHFQIKGRVGVVAYRLELPSHSKVHPVFHVSLLKEYKGDPPTTQVELPEIAEPYTSYPTAIIAQRHVEVEGALQYQVLVEWSGSSRDEATWEEWTTLVEVFPSINLEDKVLFQEGTDDTDQEGKKAESVLDSAKGTQVGSHHERLGPTNQDKRVRRPPYWAQDYT
ncbi:Retrotransposable element Tf2 [Senna tora]|uniref:Retrotransposable element Tf2 n=1 Tax=Senna tora TaxID=362788 RepID=A0A834W802_9FABA|nr:Retrotransposable element Tf2 [Senna tora]